MEEEGEGGIYTKAKEFFFPGNKTERKHIHMIKGAVGGAVDRQYPWVVFPHNSFVVRSKTLLLLLFSSTLVVCVSFRSQTRILL